MESPFLRLEESILELFVPVSLLSLFMRSFRLMRISDNANFLLCTNTGDRVRVLGEAYSPDDDEDMAMATVEAVSIPRGRSRTDVTMAKAGNWILLDGVDANISKTATITSATGDENNPAEDDDIQIFAPLKFPQVRKRLISYFVVSVSITYTFVFETFLHLGWK
jgi:hypothetical protein